MNAHIRKLLGLEVQSAQPLWRQAYGAYGAYRRPEALVYGACL